MEDFEDFKEIKEIFREIIASLQRQKRVMFYMVKSYSFLNLQSNQESTLLPNHQEPTTTL